MQDKNKHQNQQHKPALTSNKAIFEKLGNTGMKAQEKNFFARPHKILLENLYFLTHTREEAIKAGFLVEVTPIAEKLGFTLPVALTRAAWEKCIACNKADFTLSTIKRLIVLLNKAKWASMRSSSTILCLFEARQISKPGEADQPQSVILSMYTSPGHAFPAQITIRLQEED